MKKLLGIITARGGSKSIPGKNLIPFQGKPLVCRAVEVALNVNGLSRVVVSSDDREILDAVSGYGEGVPLKRPDELSRDESKSVDAVRHALECVEKEKGQKYDATLLIQPTCPLTLPEDIEKGVQIFNNTQCDSVVSVVKSKNHHPITLNEYEEKFFKVNYLLDSEKEKPRQTLINLYTRNGAFYITSRETLAKGTLYGECTLAVEMPWHRSCDIDTLDELKFAEWLALNFK